VYVMVYSGLLIKLSDRVCADVWGMHQRKDIIQ